MKYVLAKQFSRRGQGIAIVRIDPKSGETVGYQSISDGAKSLGNRTQSGISSAGARIRACCKGETQDADGYLWRFGKLYVGIEEPSDNDRKTLVGTVVDGFMIKANTGMTLPSGDAIYECECVSCGAPRLLFDTVINSGIIPKCGCIESLSILEKAVPAVTPCSKDDLRSRLLSTTTKPLPTEPKVQKPEGGTSREWTDGRKRVFQYTLDGEFIAEYPSAVDAYIAVRPDKAKALSRRKLQELSSSISTCCRGNTSYSQGYRWKYAEDVNYEKTPLGKLVIPGIAPVVEMKPEPIVEHEPESVVEPEPKPVDEPEPKPVDELDMKRIYCTDIESGILYDFASVRQGCAEVAARLKRTIDTKYIYSLCEKGGGTAYGQFWEYYRK